MINRYTCSNGVRIVTEKFPTVRSAAIGIWIGTGSRDEKTDNNGISHFLEHMFFKGTKTRSAKDIAESFDSIGGQVNAFTSKEYTCYYAKVLDNYASYALDTLADMFFHSEFAEEEMTKEKNVVYEEIKMYEDTPDDIVHDLLSKATYKNHSLGYPILGTEETLAEFTREKLQSYMHNMYTPDRVVISIAGNVTDEIIKQAEKLFGSYEGGSSSHGQAEPEMFSDKVSRKKETEQAHLCLGYQGLPIGHKDAYNLIVLNNVLGGSMSSRLFQEVREQKGLAYSVFSYHSAFQDSGLVTLYGGTGADQLDQLFETMQDTLNLLIKDGLTPKELHNSKEQLKGSLMLSLESTNSRMSRNGKNELVLKRHRTLDEIVTLIDQVELQSVNDLGKRIFERDYSVALISPDGKLPTTM
ncbi:putative Zn-dependent peptidase [Bacillus ectoiniformans]|uniref:M16 family metallopeptidase n=1 Tax=Bacillus ectoiniformans TaxID=1494429 RepID=UPI00195818EA|nr:pitrilysin family protein [Bacillus ectoiniformans]MBM7647080.1 putative Zn-dependent peptidase [Bacillus ectoiniformans]